MKKLVKDSLIALPVIAALTLVACASEYPQCSSGDWYDLGLTEGQQAKPLSEFDNLQATCLEEGISVDTPQYLKGWHKGLSSYCKPSYSLGVDDVKTGKPSRDFSELQATCKKYGAAFNANHYFLGRNVGKHQHQK